MSKYHDTAPLKFQHIPGRVEYIAFVDNNDPQYKNGVSVLHWWGVYIDGEHGAHEANDDGLIGGAMTCEDKVIQKIRQRQVAGLVKYGTTMERTDLGRRQWLVHAQEEAMDLAIYLERLIREYDTARKEHQT